MKGLFLDADEDLFATYKRVVRPDDPPLAVTPIKARLTPDQLPDMIRGYDYLFVDHTTLPTPVMAACKGVKHIVFMGTGARSVMHPEELAEFGMQVHVIKGYGDTAVAEMGIALMWAAARNIAVQDATVRQDKWVRPPGMQLTGKTIGLIGWGGIGAEMGRIAGGGGMKVIAWNRTPKSAPGVEFVELDTLLAQSDVVSVHLLLNDQTRGFLNAERIAKIKTGAILVNTARGAVVDEDAMIAALESGALRHAALDVFGQEPLPDGHKLKSLANVTLAPHAGWYTPEANDTLIRRALDIAKALAEGKEVTGTAP